MFEDYPDILSPEEAAEYVIALSKITQPCS